MKQRMWTVILIVVAGWLCVPVQALAQQEAKALWQPYYISPRAGAEHVSLDGDWDLGYRDTPIESLQDLASQPKWIHAQVPSSVQWALYRAGELPHPYYHLNSMKYTWVPDKVWYYRRTFKVPSLATGQFVFLCFDGADYYSRIWLNGTLLGRHEGMFGGPEVEVSKFLRSGADELIVEVKAPSYGVEPWKFSALENVVVPWGIAGGDGGYSTGDSGIGMKEFLPFGLWQGVRLEIVPASHLERPFLVTKEATNREARLELTTEVLANATSLDFQLHPWKSAGPNTFRNAWTSKPVQTALTLQVTLLEKDTSKSVLSQSFPLQVCEGRNWVKEEIRIPSPKLWWPNGMGDPHLYRIKLALLRQGEEIDNLEFDYGIRTIQNLPSAGPRTQDRWANWQFVVNGRPLFVKGVDWAWPGMDILLNLPRERYRWMLEAARAAGIQMIRVGIVGSPETEDFYSLCDELGMMVWEDFPIGNMEVPGWPQDVWEAQALHIIFKLRNHSSLAVWDGGNEFNPYSFRNATATGILERVMADFDGTRLFLRTTPDPGDAHLYPDMDPTWYQYVYRWVPFASETGIMDIGEPESIREIIDPHELDKPLPGIFSQEFKASHPELVHHFLQYSLVTTQLSLWSRASQIDDISAPTLDNLIDMSRFGVGEFIQIASDNLLANYPVTTGMMPWSFTTGWPVVFPAYIDAFDQSTALYYFSKRCYEPTHVLVPLPQLVWAPGEKVPISITVVHAPFTALNNLTGSVEIFDDRFQPLWRQQRQIGVTPGPSVTRRELGEFSIPQEFRDKYFFVVAELKSADGKLLSRSVYCPRSLKMMEDPAFRQKYRATPQPSLHFDHGPWLRKQVEAVPTSLALEVVSQKDVGENRSHAEVRLRNTGSCTAFFTHINIEGTKRAFYGSDNFFWLPAGEERRLEFEVLWRDPATRNKAVWTVRAWNANAAQATRSP